MGKKIFKPGQRVPTSAQYKNTTTGELKMIRLTFTDFMNIISRTGIQKANIIKEIKYRPQYERAFDFYAPLRNHIIDVHKKGSPKRALDDVLSKIVHQAKRDNYPSMVDGYKRWWGRKAISWFDPISESYIAHDVAVRVRPELGLNIDGVPHLVKLHLNKSSLVKKRDIIIVELMEMTLRGQCRNNEVMSVLDAKNSKMILGSSSRANKAMIDAELDYSANLWASI